mgnify:CR=1 FL=1
MIKSKYDYLEYLQKDKEALGMKRRHPRIFGDEVWKFEIILRKHEYYMNVRQKDPIGKILYLYYKMRHHYYGIKLGFEIPANVFGKGLRINHSGYIVINPHARVGDFCDLHQGVHVGRNIKEGSVPKIGNNVWIGPGAKLFGDIKIADNIMIGANSVVNRSILESDVTVAGVPAKIVKKQANPWKRK